MKHYQKTIALLTLALGLFTSCEQSLTEDLLSSENSDELSTEEINSAIETLSFKYAITAVNSDGSEQNVFSDEELSSYNQQNGNAKFIFPLEFIVQGETVTVNSKKEMKSLIQKKKKHHRKPPFQLVFPVSVNTIEGNVIIEDKESFKAYRESLDKGTHPEFIFPISVIYEEETLLINSEEELKALKPIKSDISKRPEFVFPISVVTAEGNISISDEEAFKSHKESLEKGIRPELVFPLSVVLNEETISINSQDEFNALFPKKGHRTNNERAKRPELVFPITISTTEGNVTISDKDAFKAHKESLEKGVRPEFVFPISVIIEDVLTIVNDEDELKSLSPKKKR